MERADFERLRWRCVRRGLLEVDISLQRFLDESFAGLTDEQQQAFAELADLEDHQLWYWISGQEECPDGRLAEIVAMMRKS